MMSSFAESFGVLFTLAEALLPDRFMSSSAMSSSSMSHSMSIFMVMALFLTALSPLAGLALSPILMFCSAKCFSSAASNSSSVACSSTVTPCFFSKAMIWALFICLS